MDTMSATVFDLPWEHVICSHILPLTQLKTCFILRQVCSDWRNIITLYFTFLRKIEMSKRAVSSCITKQALAILLQNNSVCRTLILKDVKYLLCDDVLVPFLRNNKLLRVIDLTGCNCISNACLTSIAVNCTQLEELNLTDCKWVSCKSIREISEHCSGLASLNLSGCWSIGNDVVVTVIQNCPLLRSLSLQNVYGITDVSIFTLCRYCPNLCELNIHGCWRVTDGSIRSLGEYCRCLARLSVSDCPSVSEVSLGRLRRRGVNLDVQPKMCDTQRLFMPQIKLQI